VELPDGFAARVIDPDSDSDAITDLCSAAAIAEYGTSDVTLQLVRESYRAGATRLYERAGMHVARDSRSYRLTLREGREIRPV